MKMGREYASALFTLAMEEGKQEEYGEALETVKTVFSENSEYIDFLNSFSIPKTERIDAIEEAFGKSIPEHIVSFVKLLCEKDRITEFFDCVAIYKELLDMSENISVAKITSSVELTDTEKEKLKKKLEKTYNKTVVLDLKVDKSLVMGVVVEIDGKIIDGSIKKSLSDIKDVISIIDFSPLWKTMENKNVSTYYLREKSGIDSKTIRRLRANENIETKTLDKLCSALECRLEDIAEFVED